jgi:hypothetical protein
MAAVLRAQAQRDEDGVLKRHFRGREEASEKAERRGCAENGETPERERATE